MRFKEISCKILCLLVCIGFLAAAWISYERYKLEAASQTVEMVYDYDDILLSAPLEGKTEEELFALYRKSGITSLAVYDDTPLKILSRGDAKIMRGADMTAAGVRTDCIYIQAAEKENGAAFFEDLTRQLLIRMSPDDVRVIPLEGKKTLEIRAGWSRFLEMPVGILPTRVKEAAKSGFYLVLRPQNPPHADKRDVEEFLKAVDATDKVSAILFQGKEAFGYKDAAEAFRLVMQERKIPIVIIEAQNQLGFENQAGAVDMVKASDYDGIRLYGMSKEELIKLASSEASARFYISDIERNIRMNLFPSYKFAVNGETLSETNAHYIEGVKTRLEGHGFSVGKASRMESYFPSPVLRAAAMAGALALIVLGCMAILPMLSRFALPLYGAGLLATQGLFWAKGSVLVLQALALGAEIMTPVVIMSAFLSYCVGKKDEAEKDAGWAKIFGEGLAALWLCGLLSLCGGTFVSGLLGDIRFFMEMEIFRGVKLTFVTPILLVSLIYIQKFPFFGEPVTNDRDFVRFVKKFCNIPIRLGLLMGLGVLAFVAFMFVGRSGNNMAPVPGFEIALRRFLEDHMYARPREKEFLFGHPAVFVAMAALYRRWPQILHYFLIVAVTIGQGSMTETFAHMRSPFILSLIRGLDGLAAGTAAGICALIGFVILLRITKFFGERYGKL